MSGNRIGGIKARDANLATDPDFYKRIGKIGGQRGNTGGFASLIEGKDGLTGQDRARIAGARGGRKSRRNKSTDQAASDPTPERSELLLRRRISRAAGAES